VTMDFEKAWKEALKNTEIIRTRVQPLMTMAETCVPYILLSESTINVGDTVVREGEILVEKPSLIVPPNNPYFTGFEFKDEYNIDDNTLINFLIVRGVKLPSFRYDNKTSSLNVFEDKLSKAITHYQDLLLRAENVRTGLIIGPEDVWQFSLLIFICSQITKNVDNDFKKLIDEFKRDNHA